MKIASGVTDQYIYFVAVDATDLKTRETGLSSFTVYRSRNGGAAAAMTTPTINETDSTNMPGVYELLLDEDMTIDAGDDTQEMVFHITHAGMAPVTRTIELYRPKITAGYTLGVESDGDLTKVNTLDGHTAQTGDSYARLGAPAGASVSADVAAVKSDTGAILTDTGTTLPGTLTTIEGKIDAVDGIVDDILVDTAEIGAAGAGLTEAGGTGDHLTVVPWNAAWDAEVQSEVTDALNAYDPPTKAELDSGLAALNDPTAAAIADAVWDEAKAGHVAAGSFGEEVQAHALSSEVSALNDLSAAEVNAEVVDVLRTDTIPDSYAADGSQPTIAQAVLMMLQFLTEKSVSGTTVTVKKPDGSAPAMTFTLDDGSAPTSITRS